MTGKEQKKTCSFCNGSGEISFFKGVSRFLLSSEECPVCSGLGFVLSDEVPENKESQTDNDHRQMKFQ